MTDYSKMSDFEINKAVGLATGDATATEPVFSVVIRNSTGREFNPCTSWADAGPIIEQNGIGLSKQSNGRWAASQPGRLYPQYHGNPLRAAMTVFLMMKDAENANP